jgi:hypothetical protein
MDENLEQQEQQETTLSPIEEKAIQMGWRPKEQFEGDEEEFIDAKEFVRRQPLFDRIESQNKQLKNVTKALEALKGHYTRVEEAAVQKAINQLKAQRKSALADGDGDSFELIDDEIKKAETQLQQIEQVKNNPIVEETVVHPEWQAFQSRNPWYTNTGYMRKFADEIGADLASKGIPPVEVLKQVEQAVRKEFPNKFVNPNKEKAPDVEENKGGPKPMGKSSDSFMNEQERKVMNDLVRSGLLTKEKYIADLKAVKGLK